MCNSIFQFYTVNFNKVLHSLRNNTNGSDEGGIPSEIKEIVHNKTPCFKKSISKSKNVKQIKCPREIVHNKIPWFKKSISKFKNVK